MSNYKVKVNNEAESREVQEFLKENGYERKHSNFKLVNGWVCINKDNEILCACISQSGDELNDYKELTTPQLKDLVVLKRNDKNDRNVIDPEEDANLYLDSDNKLFVFHLPTQTWKESNLNGEEEVMERLKPIIKPLKEYLRINNDGKYVLETTSEREAQEPHAKHWIEVPEGCDYLVSVFGANSFIEKSMIDKIKSNKSFKNVLWQRDKDEVMKEYLVPQDNGEYALTKATEKRVSDWVEVPEGAEAATFCKNEGVNYWKENGLKWFSKINKEWCIYSDMEEHIKNHDHKIVWTRHTQPEELPFVDDEPKSLNDTYAEIEQVRQDNVNNPSHYSDSSIECIDAMEAMMTPEQFIGYLRGNVFKYQWRYEKKNGIEDLKKAQWYLDKLVTKVNEKHAIF